MKFNWNKRYTTYAIYAAIVSAAVIFCIFVGVYIDHVWLAITNFFNVLSPLIYGFIIAYLLNPLLKLFEKTILRKIKHRMAKRGFAVALTYIVFLFALGLLVYAIVPQLGRTFSELEYKLAVYSQNFQEWMENVKNQPGFMGKFVSWISTYVDFSFLDQPMSNIIQVVYDLVRKFSPYIMDFFGAFAIQLANILIGLIFAGYLLCSKELLFAQVNKITHVFFKEKRIEKIKTTVTFVHKTFGQYIIGMFVDALIVGCLTGIGMFILSFITGMPRDYIALVSVIVACTNIIPIFGPFIGGIPSALFIFIADPINALWFALMILVIQQIDGNFIAPRVLGSSTGIPALYVIVAITVMGGFFGFIGMIIGVPVFAIAGKILTDKTRKKIKEKKAALNKGESSSDDYTDEDYDGFDEFDSYSDRPEETDNSDIALRERYSEHTSSDIEDTDVSGGDKK